MTTLLSNNTRRPDVSFHPDGHIDITARIAKMLHLQDGDVIDVAVQNDEYLLFVRKKAADCTGRHEASVHPTNKGKNHSNNFRAYSSRLCNAVHQVAFPKHAFDNPARFPAGNPILFGPNGTGIPIITRNPL